jgi:hypothetical protein
MNNIIMNNPSRTKKNSRSALALFTASAAIAMLVSSASAQTPTPWPTWPPPKGSSERDQVIKTIAGFLRHSADGTIDGKALRDRLQSPASARTELQDKLGLNLLLPTKMVIVFYEPDVDSGDASCTVQPKNGLYSVFALSKTPIPTTMPDKDVVNTHFMCCYDPY